MVISQTPQRKNTFISDYALELQVFLYLRSPPQPFRAPPPSFHLGRNPKGEKETEISVLMKRAEGVSLFNVSN